MVVPLQLWQSPPHTHFFELDWKKLKNGANRVQWSGSWVYSDLRVEQAGSIVMAIIDFGHPSSYTMIHQLWIADNQQMQGMNIDIIIKNCSSIIA
jgi:hypothetical protein